MDKKEEIRFIRHKITERPTSDIIDFKFSFNQYDGYLPLLAIENLFDKSGNKYFNNSDTAWATYRVTNNISLASEQFTIRYKRNYRATPMVINSGFMSVMGMSKLPTFMPSSLFDTMENRATYKMSGDVDIFCLGLVKLTGLPQIIPSRSRTMKYFPSRSYHEIRIDPSKVKILISQEKLRKTTFTRDNYTATVRSAILNKLRAANDKYNLDIEDVPDEYIYNFVKKAEHISSNSIVEIMEIDNRIKENVFTNFNKQVV